MVLGAGGYDLGTAHGRVIIDASGVGAAMQQAQGFFRTGLSGIGTGIQQVGQQLQGLGANLTVLTAPLLAFGGAGISVAADFEGAMAEIAARTGLTGEAMEEIRQLAIQMGADTAFSAQDAANAFLQLLSSGQSAEEAIATLPAVLDAAAASGENLGSTADAITDIMAAFGLQATDASMITEALARAAGSSSATMGDLVQGFQNVGGMAAQFGLSVDETAAILAVFSENGIKGAEAGTQLRSMLRNMTRDTEDVQGMWNRLGISMFDVMGNARPLQDVMNELSVAMAGMTDQERIEVLSTLGGAYGQLGLAALTGSISMDEMQASMAASASASEVAAARMDTFNGRMESLRGSVETLMIEALTPLMENTLQPLVEQVIEVVNGITAWVQQNPELAGQIALLAGSLAVAGPVLVIVGTALSAIGGALAFLLSPIGLVIAGVVALGAAWVTNFGGIRDIVQPILDRLIGVLQSAWASIQPSLAAIYNWFITEGLPRVRDFVETVVMPTVERFIGIIGDIWTRIQPGLQAFFNWVVTDGLPIITNLWDTVLRPAIETVIDILFTLWEVVGPVLAELFNWFVEYGLPVVTNFINEIFIPALQTIVGVISNIWEAVRPHLQNLQTGMDGIFSWIRDNILTPVFEFINRIISAVGEAIVQLQQLLGLQGGAPAGTVPGQFGAPDTSGFNFSQTGLSYVPYDLFPAMLHEGEAVLNAGDAQRWRSGGGSGGGTQNHFGPGSVVIQANSYAEGQEAARGFEDHFREARRGRG